MTYTPLEDRILVNPIKKTEEEKSESGLILDMVKKEVGEGVVHAAGMGRYAGETGTFIPTMLHKGDVVLYGLHTGMPMDVPDDDGKKVEMKLMREGDVLMLIKRADEN